MSVIAEAPFPRVIVLASMNLMFRRDLEGSIEESSFFTRRLTAPHFMMLPVCGHMRRRTRKRACES